MSKVKTYIFKESKRQVTIFVNDVFYDVNWFSTRQQARNYAKMIKNGFGV